MQVAVFLIIQFFQPINLIIMMSLKAKQWEECQVNDITEPFILLSHALTYKQRIKHVHALGINVFSCTVDVSDDVCCSNSNFHAFLERKNPVRKSLCSLFTHVESNVLFAVTINYSSAAFL